MSTRGLDRRHELSGAVSRRYVSVTDVVRHNCDRNLRAMTADELVGSASVREENRSCAHQYSGYSETSRGRNRRPENPN